MSMCWYYGPSNGPQTEPTTVGPNSTKDLMSQGRSKEARRTSKSICVRESFVCASVCKPTHHQYNLIH